MAEKLTEYEVSLPFGDPFIVRAPEGLSQVEVYNIAIQSQLPQRTQGFGTSLLDAPLSALNEFVIGGGEAISGMSKFISDPIIEAGLNLVSPGYGTRGREAAELQRNLLSQEISRRTVAQPTPLARETGGITASLLAGGLKLPSVAATAFPKLGAAAERAIQGAVGAQAVETPDMTQGEAAALGAGVNVALPPAMRALLETRPVQFVGQQLTRLAAPVATKIDEGAEALRRAIGIGDEATPTEAFLPSVQQARQAAMSRTALPAEVQQAIPDVTEALGPEAAQRLRNFARIGVTQPTTGMITREPGMWSYERNIMKRPDTGDALRNAAIKVNDEINTAATNLVKKIGVAGDVEKVGLQAAEALTKKQKEMQQVVGQLYTQAREKFGDKSAGAVPNFLQKLDDPDFVDSVDNASIIDSIYKRLGRFGMLGESGLPRDGAVMTVAQAESLRGFINKLGNGADPNIQRVRRELIDALDDDVVEGFGDDAFKEARTAARQRFEEFKNTLAGRIGQDAKINAEKVTSSVMKAGYKDLRKLKATLLSGTGEQRARGQEAWSSIGAQAVQDLFEKAGIGDNVLSGKRLRDAFRDNMVRYRELLGREDFVTLNRIVRAAGDANIDVDFASINRSGTAAELEAIFKGAAVDPQSKIRNYLQQFAVLLTPASGPGNVALMMSQQAGEAAATRAAAEEAARREILTTQPANVAEEIIRSRFTQPGPAPTRGLRAPGMISSAYAAENPPPEQVEYAGSWQWNPETQSAEFVPFTAAELAQMRRPR